MAALTDDIEVKERSGGKLGALTVLDTEIIYAGALIAVDANEEAQAAANTAALKVVGVAPKRVDNTNDGETTEVKRGIFCFADGGDTSADRNDIGSKIFVVDDQTVGLDGAGVSNSIQAGVIVDVDSDGVWVDTRLANV